MSCDNTFSCKAGLRILTKMARGITLCVVAFTRKFFFTKKSSIYLVKQQKSVEETETLREKETKEVSVTSRLFYLKKKKGNVLKTHTSYY